MKVVLTKALKISPNGYEVVTYEAGEHDLEGNALKQAKAMGLVKESKPKATPKKAAK